VRQGHADAISTVWVLVGASANAGDATFVREASVTAERQASENVTVTGTRRRRQTG